MVSGKSFGKEELTSNGSPVWLRKSIAGTCSLRPFKAKAFSSREDIRANGRGGGTMDPLSGHAVALSFNLERSKSGGDLDP